MKVVRWLTCLLLALAGLPALAQNSLSRLERVHFLDREYIRLADWARANGFELTWPKPGKTVRLSNGSCTLVFTADSCQVLVNGIKVWLSFPVAVRDNRAYVSLLDMQNSICPIVFPAKTAPRIRLIALDPGHGGKDKGYHQGSIQEKKHTLLLAQELRDQLSRAGIKSILTRTSDVTVDLSVRTDLANRRGADLFVSLHFNSAGRGNSEAQGVEVYCLTPAGARSTNARGAGGGDFFAGSRYNDRSVLLAYHLQRALVKNLGMEDRGVRRARFEVLRSARMPAVLIECGFLSNPAESRKILDPAWRRQAARAIVAGLQAYSAAGGQ